MATTIDQLMEQYPEKAAQLRAARAQLREAGLPEEAAMQVLDRAMSRVLSNRLRAFRKVDPKMLNGLTPEEATIQSFGARPSAELRAQGQTSDSTLAFPLTTEEEIAQSPILSRIKSLGRGVAKTGELFAGTARDVGQTAGGAAFDVGTAAGVPPQALQAAAQVSQIGPLTGPAELLERIRGAIQAASQPTSQAPSRQQFVEAAGAVPEALARGILPTSSQQEQLEGNLDANRRLESTRKVLGDRGVERLGDVELLAQLVDMVGAARALKGGLTVRGKPVGPRPGDFDADLPERLGLPEEGLLPSDLPPPPPPAVRRSPGLVGPPAPPPFDIPDLPGIPRRTRPDRPPKGFAIRPRDPSTAEIAEAQSSGQRFRDALARDEGASSLPPDVQFLRGVPDVAEEAARAEDPVRGLLRMQKESGIPVRDDVRPFPSRPGSADLAERPVRPPRLPKGSATPDLSQALPDIAGREGIVKALPPLDQTASMATRTKLAHAEIRRMEAVFHLRLPDRQRAALARQAAQEGRYTPIHRFYKERFEAEGAILGERASDLRRSNEVLGLRGIMPEEAIGRAGGRVTPLSRPEVDEMRAGIDRLRDHHERSLAQDLADLDDFIKKSGKFKSLVTEQDVKGVVDVVTSVFRGGVKSVGRGTSAAARYARDFIPSNQRVLWLKTKLGAEEAAAMRNAIKAGKPFESLDPAVRTAIFRAVKAKGGPESVRALLPPEIAAKAFKAIEEMDPIFKKIAQNEKILDELLGTKFAAKRQLLANTYLRRQYYSRLVPGWKPTAEVREKAVQWVMQNVKNDAGQLMDSADANLLLDSIMTGRAPQEIPGLRGPAALFTGNLKKRKNIPPEIREFLGEVRDGVHLAMITMADQERTIASAKFFRQLNDELPKIIARTPDSQMVKLSETGFGAQLSPVFGKDAQKILGEIYTKPIPRHLAEEIVDTYHMQEGMSRWFLGAQGLLKRKFTSYNPSTHMNNLIGNMPIAHIAGNSPFNPINAPHYLEALRGLITNTDVYQEAISSGALRGGFFAHEGKNYMRKFAEALAAENATDTGAILKAFTKVKHALKQTDGAIAGVYDAEDQLFKLATFIKLRKGQMTSSRFAAKKYRDLVEAAAKPGEEGAAAAAEYINLLFPNYDWLGLSLRRGRRNPLSATVFNPFVSFPAEAARVAFNGAQANPLGIGMVGMTVASAGTLGAMAMGITPEEHQQALDKLPSYQRHRLLVPYRGATGIEFMDLTYKFPLAELAYGFRPDQGKSGPQLPGRAIHAFSSVFLGGWLTRGQGFGEEPVLSQENLTEQFAKLVESPWAAIAEAAAPPAIARAAKAATLRARGVEANKFGEPLVSPATEVLGLRPVFAESRRQAMETRGEVTGATKEGTKAIREAARERDEERKTKEAERLRMILKNIRENRP